jgi:hypothetical protein
LRLFALLSSGSVSKHLALAHFEEAVDDEDELREIGRKSSANDIFLTLATNFLTEVPAREHLLQNCSLPNCDAPVKILVEDFVRCLRFRVTELPAR